MAEAVEELDPLDGILLGLRVGGGDLSGRRAEPVIQRLVRPQRRSKKTNPQNHNGKPNDRFHANSNLYY